MFKEVVRLAAVVALAGSLAAWGQEAGSQNVIAREVSHELVTLPFYLVFDHLTFHVDNGTVTIQGQVTQARLKSDAENALKQIVGVRRVIDDVEVLPASSTDEKIRLAEYLALYGDPELNQYSLQATPPIHIIVKNGAVTLEGSVFNQDDKTEAFTRASGVPGVTSLTNHLQISP